MLDLPLVIPLKGGDDEVQVSKGFTQK